MIYFFRFIFFFSIFAILLDLASLLMPDLDTKHKQTNACYGLVNLLCLRYIIWDKAWPPQEDKKKTPKV